MREPERSRLWFPSSGLGTPALAAPAFSLVVDASEIAFASWSMGTRKSFRLA